MRASIFAVIVGITQVLSRNIKVSDENSNFIEKNSNNINLRHAPSYDSINQTANLLVKNDGDFVNLIKRFETVLSTRSYPKNKENLNSNGLNLIKGYTSSEEEDRALVRVFSRYFKDDPSLNNCVNLTSLLCPILKSYESKENQENQDDENQDEENQDEENQDEENGMNKLQYICSDKEDSCDRILKYLSKLCLHVKDEQEKIVEVTKDTCDEHLEKCYDLEMSCDGLLKNTCDKIKEECEILNNPACKRIPESQEPEPTHEPPTTISPQMYTGVGTVIEHVTETTTVEAKETCTRFQTEIKTVTTCVCGCCEACSMTKTSDLPEPTLDPEPESEEEEEPEPEEPEPEEPEPEEPELEPEPEEPEPEEPELEPEPEKPDASKETCETMTTVVVTVQPTDGSEECKTDKTPSEAHRIQIKGFNGGKIVFIILGIMSGMWIIG